MQSCSFSSDSQRAGDWSRTVGLQDTEDLVTYFTMSEPDFPYFALEYLLSQGFHTSDKLDLGDTVAVTEDNTNLRRGGTLLGQLADVVDNLVGGGLEPGRGSAGVGDGGGRNALALGVKATHCC